MQSITTLKREASELIERARERRAPLVITQSGVPTAVLQDIESFERQKRAFLLLKLLAQGERAYESGRTMGAREARRRFAERLAALGEQET